MHSKQSVVAALVIFLSSAHAVWWRSSSAEARGRPHSGVTNKVVVDDAPSHDNDHHDHHRHDHHHHHDHQHHLHEHALLSSIKRHRLETNIGPLVKDFRTVLHGLGLIREIDVARLLRACKRLAVFMRSTGQKQSARDLENNIQKVEALYRITPAARRHTLSSLLGFEKEMGKHKGAELSDPSAAVGLLWIRRSISFQYCMYKLLLDTDQEPRPAAMAAYCQELQPYLGWAIQRICKIALRSRVPLTKEILFSKLGGFQIEEFGEAEEQATKRDIRDLLDVWRPIIARWEEIFAHLNLEDTRRV